MNGYGSQARVASTTLTATQAASTTPNAMMNDHEPPNRATASAMLSPRVNWSAITSLGLRAARIRTRSWAAWNCRPTIVSMSRPAIGLRCSKAPMSLRSISMVVVSSRATAIVWCGAAESIEASPNISPLRGASMTTSWLSSSITITCTWPLSTR